MLEWFVLPVFVVVVIAACTTAAADSLEALHQTGAARAAVADAAKYHNRRHTHANHSNQGPPSKQDKRVERFFQVVLYNSTKRPSICLRHFITTCLMNLKLGRNGKVFDYLKAVVRFNRIPGPRTHWKVRMCSQRKLSPYIYGFNLKPCVPYAYQWNWRNSPTANARVGIITF